jgi:hypothetical protein
MGKKKLGTEWLICFLRVEITGTGNDCQSIVKMPDYPFKFRWQREGNSSFTHYTSIKDQFIFFVLPNI